MDDIFKVIFYTIAIGLWILYKYREQKKSGVFKPITEKPPAEPVPDYTKSNQPSKILKPKDTPITSKKVIRQDIPRSLALENNSLSLEYEALNETYLSPYMEQLIKDDNLLTEEENRKEAAHANPVFIFDLPNAVIGSIILTRPNW